jgi:hypothetical protein
MKKMRRREARVEGERLRLTARRAGTRERKRRAWGMSDWSRVERSEWGTNQAEAVGKRERRAEDQRRPERAVLLLSLECPQATGASKTGRRRWRRLWRARVMAEVTNQGRRKTEAARRASTQTVGPTEFPSTQIFW